MKSIKPGRGPSMMSGFIGIIMIGFGILWTVLAAQTSTVFALFGVLWTCAAIGMTVYNFKNATGKNRHSTFDVVDEEEEPDPLNERFGNLRAQSKMKDEVENKFCPYCGIPIDGGFKYCNKCGKKLP